MRFDDALEYLNSFVNYERSRDPKSMRAVKLDRMRRLCKRLGDPQRCFRSVLVAGTNGKGSICEMLYAMLRQSPLRVGIYTSPHLESVRERIRTSCGVTSLEGSALASGADWIREEEFAALVEELKGALEEMRRETPEDQPTYFEILTALAFLFFRHRRIEIAVLEVGMGGRLDATNVVEQAVSVIGPIGMDHCDVLGEDFVSIAKEKAGIIASNQVVISAQQSDDVAALLHSVCEEHCVMLWMCGIDFTVRLQDHSLEGQQAFITGLRGVYESLEFPLRGRHQAHNAAIAIAALEALSTTGAPHSLVTEGLSQVACPGRFEIVHDNPLVIMDCAHNPHAARALSDTIEELCRNRPIHLLLGMSREKLVQETIEPLGRLSKSVTCTKSSHPRAMEPVVLAKRISAFCPDVNVMSDASDAYTYLLNALEPSDVVVITGSVFLVGELRRALRKAHSAASLMPKAKARGD